MIWQLEQEITDLECVSVSQNNQQDLLYQKRMELRILLQERVKGALICARFTKLRDMDAPTTFFFNLEKSSRTGEADGLPSSAKRPSYNRSS